MSPTSYHAAPPRTSMCILYQTSAIAIFFSKFQSNLAGEKVLGHYSRELGKKSILTLVAQQATIKTYD